MERLVVMENYSIVIPSYTTGPKAYEKIEEYCGLYGKRAVVIGGKKAMVAAGEKLLQAVEKTSLTITGFVWFGGECTFAAARRLAKEAAVKEADIIFAVGGGKAVDTAKLVSLELQKPYAAFPTIASNCAAASSVSIVYNEDGSFCEFVHFLKSAVHVFVDTDIIAKAPFRYLWAGIGDTYAKYYEVSISAQGESLEHFRALGVNMSRMCMETLVEHGAQALTDNKAQNASYALEQAALAIIITTGWVSMLVARDHTMDYNGGAAHAFFYSLCSLPGFDETQENHLHGVVVGFGVLLLLLIDGREEECRRLQEFNQKIGLPVKLSDIGVTLEDVAKVAPLMVKDEDVEHYPYVLTPEMILEAAGKLDV
ncbi:MAG: iron-containing alcohol dehydrogenase family protein [Lachnospiraceae bacterium]|nr:iron-containing alcohol dehydrogenase family protein [Lachnospiraceae bacterium]